MSSRAILFVFAVGLLCGCGGDPAEHNKNLPAAKAKPGELKIDGGKGAKATAPQ